jgi:predicted CopG family antitoxin
LPEIENNGSAVINEKLKEIDQLLKDDKIDPLEYIRRRKEQVESLIEGKPKLSIEEIEEPPQEILPAPKMVRVAVIVKSFFRKQVFTAPENWELPKTITDKVINSIFKMAEKRNVSDIKLRAGEYKIAGIAGEKNKIALMILDADEEFETYDAEMMRVYEILRKDEKWSNALKHIHG